MPRRGRAGIVQNMKQTRFREAERALAKRSRRLAEFQRRSVTPERLFEAISDYVEWWAFAYWVRLIVQTEGCVSTAVRAALEARCPGFLTRSLERNEAAVSLWRRLNSWIDKHVFGYAKAEGWSHALGYYAVRDPRCGQVEAYWLHCDQTWKSKRPTTLPTFEEWRVTAADFVRSG